jgi:predicted amidohydrolase
LGVDRFLTPGDALAEPLEAPLGRLGILICYDLRFPEPARAFALQGAQAILVPTAWPDAATLYPDHVARTRASENGVYLLAADHVGEEEESAYLGRSLAVVPDGEVIAEAARQPWASCSSPALEPMSRAITDHMRRTAERRWTCPRRHRSPLQGK